MQSQPKNDRTFLSYIFKLRKGAVVMQANGKLARQSASK